MTVPARRARRQEDEMNTEMRSAADRMRERSVRAEEHVKLLEASLSEVRRIADESIENAERADARVADLEREVGRLRYREDQRIRDRDEALEEARIRRDQEAAIIARAEQAERERDDAVEACRMALPVLQPGADDEARARALVNATPDLAAQRVAASLDEARREGEARGRAWGGNTSRCCVSDCTRYADYCEAHAEKARREGAQAEREACAAEAEREPLRSSGEIAAAIRARESGS